ncbi:hypothetical protein [Hoeflea sp.]|uniref:hypothetical protein n=1 Tax=Hoeflea sp. TaxID=1940281 RepID=UPI003B51DF91
MSDLVRNPIRIGYMAGREIPVHEIAEQMDCSPALIRNALVLAGVKPPTDCGPSILLSVPITDFVLDIDQVGKNFRMNREEVLRALVMRALRAGPERMIQLIEGE